MMDEVTGTIIVINYASLKRLSCGMCGTQGTLLHPLRFVDDYRYIDSCLVDVIFLLLAAQSVCESEYCCRSLEAL